MKSAIAATIMLAHSWYPGACCHDQDCHPVPCGDIKSDGRGWTSGGVSIYRRRVREIQWMRVVTFVSIPLAKIAIPTASSYPNRNRCKSTSEWPRRARSRGRFLSLTGGPPTSLTSSYLPTLPWTLCSPQKMICVTPDYRRRPDGHCSLAAEPRPREIRGGIPRE